MRLVRLVLVWSIEQINNEFCTICSETVLFPLHSRDHQRECNVHDRSRKRRTGNEEEEEEEKRVWHLAPCNRVVLVILRNAPKHFRASLFLLINIGQCCRRNNTDVKQQSAIKSGYRKCYRTSRIVFCGKQKYWIFYNAIKRSQTITMRWGARGHRERKGG